MPQASPQQVLWSAGSRLLAATVHDADQVLREVIGEVAAAVGADFGALYDHEFARGEVMVRASWPDFDGPTDLRADATLVLDRLGAGGGHALLGHDELFGDETPTRGQTALSLVADDDTHRVVLGIGGAASAWTEEEEQILRGLGMLIRQFDRRIRAERDLAYRRELDGVALEVAGRLQGVDADAFREATGDALRVVFDAVGASSIAILDVIDDEHFELPVLLTATISLPDLGRVRVPDVRGVTGLDIDGLEEFTSQMRVFTGAGLGNALLGSDAEKLDQPDDAGRAVLVVPADTPGGSRSCLMIARDALRPWNDVEIDTLTTVAALVAQTQARCRAEEDSRARFAAQNVLADAGHRFVRVAPANALGAADESLRDVGQSLGAEFVLVVSQRQPDNVAAVRLWRGPVASSPGRFDPAAVGLAELLDIGRAGTFTWAPPSSVVAAWGLPETSPWNLVVSVIPRFQLALVVGFERSSRVPAPVVADTLLGLGDLVTQLQLRVDAEQVTERRLLAETFLSDVADAFLGGSAEVDARIEQDTIERVVTLLGLHGLAVFDTDGLVTTTGRVAVGADPLGPGLETGASGPPLDALLPDGNAHVVMGPASECGDLERVWGDVSVARLPVHVGDQVTAVVAAARPTRFDEVDRGVLRSFSVMLGQFRARVAAERRDDLRIQREQLLSDVVADLADAGADDLADTIERVFSMICERVGLTELAVWRVDAHAERYVPGRVGRPATAVADPPSECAWGEHEVLDAARSSRGATVEHWGTTPDGDEVTHLAFARDDRDTPESLLVARSDGDGPWAPDTIALLESVSSVLRDVEARVVAERYSDAAFNNAPVGIVMRDPNLALITCNQAFLDFIGAESVEEIAGTMPETFYADGDENVDWIGDATSFEGEAAFVRQDGARVWGLLRATLVEGDSGDHFWLNHVEDVTDRRRAEALLRFQATHDELTGLANRGRLGEEIRALAAAGRGAAVLLLDLDRFKNVNDSLGHDHGDELLIIVADRIRLAVRPGDLVARLGGDEFAVLLAGPVTVTDAELVANRLLRLVGEPVTLGSQRLYPTASIGIAASETPEIADLMRRADTAMYRAKAQGRARHESFDETLAREVTDRLATEAGLRDALRNGEFSVHYQPEVAIGDGRMLGAEALVRWEHPERGVIPAAAFIGVAEETGLVVEMGTFVLFEALQEAATWPGGDAAPMVAVNLAAAQLQREDTVALVRTALEGSGLPAHRLCLEITESAVMADLGRTDTILAQLKDLGVELAVDDFGTGFSSLAYLKRFPVDSLKIDRAFVTGLAEDSDDRAFVRSIVSLAEALDLSVVAEGVETVAQAAVLAELGCTRAQGYLYAKPGPADALREFLARR